VLLHDEDCGPLPDSWAAVPAVRFVVTDRLQHCPGKLVDKWIAGACADAEARVGTVTLARSAEEVTDWCRVNGVVEVWAFRPLTGFVGDALVVLATGLATTGIKLHYADRGHDITFFPMATRGFFPFWEAASVTLRRR
jgi:hypothetical protein